MAARKMPPKKAPVKAKALPAALKKQEKAEAKMGYGKI